MKFKNLGKLQNGPHKLLQHLSFNIFVIEKYTFKIKKLQQYIIGDKPSSNFEQSFAFQIKTPTH